ncbi:MAG: hypothetical protein JSR33_13255 [Proteobacteria bacterium]|nr:hypothetical protein [Pseudomonadota bacterium]
MKNQQMYLKVAASILAILSLGVLAGCAYDPYVGGYYAGSPYYSHCGTTTVVHCGGCCSSCCSSCCGSSPYGYAAAYPTYTTPFYYYPSYSYGYYGWYGW